MFTEPISPELNSPADRVAAGTVVAPQPLKLLVVEDSVLDCELVVQELWTAGFAPEWHRVDTEAGFLAGLQAAPDLVLSDFQMPRFSGLRALELLKQHAPDTPFILVSGTIGEDTAVAAMQQGASDYLLKDRLGRLGAAVTHALGEARLRRERRQLAQAQLENAEFVRNVLNSLTSAVVVLDELGNITATNEPWQRFGRENGGGDYLHLNYLTVCATSVRMFDHADARAAADGIRRVLAGGAAEFSLEYPCHSPTERRWFLMHVSPLGGAKRGAVVAHENITSRKLAEAALQRQQTELRVLFDYLPVMICFKSPDNVILRANQRLADTVGKTVAEIEGKPAVEIFLRDAVTYFAADLEVIQSGVPRLGLVESVPDAAGHPLTIRTDRVPVRNGQGKVVGLVLMAEDITEQNRAATRLLESQQRLALATESAHLGIWDWDVAGNKLVWDAQMYALYGTRPEDFSGAFDAWQKGLHPEDRARSEAAFAAALVGPGGFHIEFRVQWPGGEVRDIEAHAEVTRAADGSPLHVIGVNRDVTEKRRTENELRQREEHFRFLNDLGEATRGLAAPAQVMAISARMLGGHLRASRCAYAEVEPDGEGFTILHDYTNGCATTVGSYQLSLFGARATAPLREGRTLVIRSVDVELLPADGADMFNAIGIKAIITCPLVKNGGLRALMAVHQSTPRDWQPDEIILVQDVCARSWAMIERMTAEKLLREHEALLRIAGATARIGGWALDLATAQLTWSEEVCTIHEVPYPYAIDLEHAIDFYVPQSRESIRAAFAACSGLGTPYDLELEIVSAKGRPVWVRTIGAAQRNAAGAILRVQGSLQDITERKRAALVLQESEEKFRQLIENSSDVITVVSGAGVIQYQSPSTLRILGYQPEEVLGQVVTTFIHPEDRGKATQSIQQALSDALVSVPVEYRIRHRDGTWRTFQSIGRAMADSSGDKVVVVNSRDVTYLHKLELQFLRTQRLEAIGTLSSGIAHDLNNILAPITMIVPMLREKCRSPQDAELLTMIEQGALRGATIIKQLLTFSRGVEGERGPVQVAHLLKEMAGIVRETFPRDLTVGQSIPTNLWPINADATQIHQVLLNLCVNARDAMPAGGKISLAAENEMLDDAAVAPHPPARPGRFVHLAISDTGEGIPADNLARIFEPFFTTKEIGKGTGLGLSTVLGIVKSHGGFVAVYSEPGSGTTFNVHLPAIASGVAPGAGAATRPHAGKRELILVVDDEAAIRRSLSLILELHNYRVVVAADGREAEILFRANRGQIRLLLTDLMMPGMNGVALIRLLRADDPQLRVIAASGLHDDERRAELTALGVTSILAKPFRAEEVLAAVHRELAAGA